MPVFRFRNGVTVSLPGVDQEMSMNLDWNGTPASVASIQKLLAHEYTLVGHIFSVESVNYADLHFVLTRPHVRALTGATLIEGKPPTPGTGVPEDAQS